MKNALADLLPGPQTVRFRSPANGDQAITKIASVLHCKVDRDLSCLCIARFIKIYATGCATKPLPRFGHLWPTCSVR